MTRKPDQCLGEWTDREAIAEIMIPLIGQLYRNSNVMTSIHGRGLINRSMIAIMKVYRFARHRMADDAELLVHEASLILRTMSEFKLGAASVDLGKMVAEFKAEGNDCSIEDFVKAKLAKVIGRQNDDAHEGTDVILYGFGHVGRLLARILIEKTGGGDDLCLHAIVVRKGAENDLVRRASLLRWGSVHDPLDGTITIDEEDNMLTASNNLIQVIYSNGPASIDCIQCGVKSALLVDNIGKWRDTEGLDQHLKCPGIDRAILTTPGRDTLKSVMYDISRTDISADDKIISTAFCTTNAIVPVLRIVSDQYGTVDGRVETVRSYTNDQNLIDNFHKGSRRSRGASLNVVITETGAATTAVKTLPVLKGKLADNVIHMPTPDVSMAILNLNLEKATAREEISEYLRRMAMHSDLQKQIDFVSSQEMISTDFVGSRHAGVADAEAAIYNGDRVVLYVWYDNEFGYGCQVMRVMEDMAGVNPPAFPR